MSAAGDDEDSSFLRNYISDLGLSRKPLSPELHLKCQNSVVLSTEDLCDPLLEYPRVTSPHHRNNPRGLCLLINQRDFDREKTGQERRDGTDVDADSIERTFIKLGYAVNRASNLSLHKMQMLLRDVSLQDHTNFDSFVCVVLSHGMDGLIYASDGCIPTDNLIGHFRGNQCPSLIGKPKLFFIQACRGCLFDKGVRLEADSPSEVIISKLPIEADIFVANSTVPGYFAWRNSNTGSWFIQELCTVLESDFNKSVNNHHDVSTLLTVVARKVAFLYESNTGQPGSHGMKQMVSVASTLTRRAFLSP